jgi:nicotinate phosphoribosyltransferase
MSDQTQALHTDFYQLTMSAIYYDHGFDGEATFSLFLHDLPASRNFMVMAGLEQALDILENFAFSADDLDYLASLGNFEQKFLDHLGKIRFSGEVWAVPEGALCGAAAPLLEVTAPIIEAQLVETILMNTINLHSTIASKAARCRLAARGRDLLEFGLRRTQGLHAGLAAARSAAMVGFLGTSNVAAAKLYGITPAGTMAHSYITAFNSELEAFRAFAQTFPQSTILLVDTYDALSGVQKAIELGLELKAKNLPLAGIRLDSGDLAALSREARRMLDAAGLTSTRVVASGNLEEYRIRQLLAQEAAIDVFAVGTRMSCSADAPALDLAYKLSSYQNRPTVKLSTGKETLPNPKQVWRQFDGQGKISADIIALRHEKQPGQPLLRRVMAQGRRLQERSGWRQARETFEAGLLSMPQECLELEKQARPPVRLSPALNALRQQMRRQALGRP